MMRIAGCERAGMGIEALVERQQRRVNVEQPSFETLHEFRRQDAHETSECHEPCAASVEFGRESGVEARAVGKLLHRHDACRNSERGGTCEASRGVAVGNDSNYLVGRSRGERGSRDGFHVAAAPGDDHGHRHRHAGHSSMTTPREPLPTPPMIQAVSPEALRCARVASTSAGATTTTMPMPQLNVRYISGADTLPAAASQSNTGSRAQLRRCSSTSRPSGITRGMVAVRPPPVMCAKPLTLIFCASDNIDFT